MNVLLDTSVLIDVLRGDRSAVAYVSGLASVPATSEVCRAEVLLGMRSSEQRATLRLLDALDVRPVDRAIAERAGALGRTYRRSHPAIGVADLLVAATADLTRLPIATRNVRHFPMYRDLRPPY